MHDIKYAFVSLISTLEFRDVIDVAVLAYIIYILLKLIRETRAGQLVKGILLLVAGYFASSFLQLKNAVAPIIFTPSGILTFLR